jgi:Domain of unknown function (DUF6745)
MTGPLPPYTGILLPAHHAYAAGLAERWRAAAFSTGPVDRPAVEAQIRAVYQAAGLPQPAQIIWADSGNAAYHKLIYAPGLGSCLIDQLFQEAIPNAADMRHNRIAHVFNFGLRYPVIRDLATGGPARYPFSRAEACAPSILHNLGYWSGRTGIGLSALASQTIQKDTTGNRALAAALAEVSLSVPIWWPCEHAAVIVDRPTRITVDQIGRLHAENGPALEFADGWQTHRWHGTAVPAALVTGDGLTAAEILAEDNVEIRRCAIERMGWPQFINDAALARVGGSWPDPGNPGRALALYHAPAGVATGGEPGYGDEGLGVLLCANGTDEADGSRRVFGLTVPEDLPGHPLFPPALVAAAWTYDDESHPVRMTPELYATLARRT